MMPKNETYDELAGVVDLFGALTRAELHRALEELAYKQGKGTKETALSEAVERAVREYYLVEYNADDVDGARNANGTDNADDADRANSSSETETAEATLLTVGPVAFPRLPPNAEDLPHILDVDRRRVDRKSLGEQVRERLVGDAARTVDEGDEERIERLVDVSYDLEAWAPVEVDEARAGLDEALQDKTDEQQ